MKRRLVVIAATLSLLAIPTSYVFASHVFTDVPSGAYYHNSVTAVFNAGVTSGCGGTKYCPNNAVTRGQMAVFLNKVGGLSLASNGQPHTVIDALTDQGTVLIHFFGGVALSGNSAASVCGPSTQVGPIAADFGDYTIMHRIYDTPAGIEPSEVNIQLRDADDPAPDEYEICLSTLDGTTPLPDGLYKTYGTEMVFLGQGLFGP